MTVNLFQNLLSTSPFKIVNTTSGSEVVKGLSISKISIKLSSTPMRHMKEDGSTVVDSRVIQPTSISVDAFCSNDDDMLNQANNLMIDRSNLYSLTSKGVVVDRLMTDLEQIKQSPDVMSAVPIRLSFKQILSKNIKPTIFAQPANASVISRGISLIGTSKTTISNLYSSIVK